MGLLHHCSPVPTVRFLIPHRIIMPLRYFSPRLLTVRSSLPFPSQKAKYHRELEAAVHVVERACRLCVDVKRSLLSGDGRILEKNDQTPVTVADFGVQALISLDILSSPLRQSCINPLTAFAQFYYHVFTRSVYMRELGKLFPSIPLVAEEDSAFLRSNNLADLVVDAVTGKAKFGDKQLTHDDVLDAIDRGGKDAFTFGANPATYWVLDPIDGTRGFLKGCEALYVVGLALVVEGEIALGVMGCPNWQEDLSSTEVQEDENKPSGPGIIMVSHVGCGTWIKRFYNILDISPNMPDCWNRSFVDQCCLVHEARFCIPESQTWESLPLSDVKASADGISIADKEILLLPTCCGRRKGMYFSAGILACSCNLSSSIGSFNSLHKKCHIVNPRLTPSDQVTDWNGSQLDIEVDQVERRVIFPSGGILVSNGNLHDRILEMISSRLSFS
ncbi:putative PAP-specific phosphatase, mitochondrial [Vitis vinifera]|uniref:Putative PAP-specific phosphatase, mitochondrial n=1 Tax=Vitis vinifera TaxID=29760 RepID=A0A438EF63_VITVI|nr:putative PAP-specific phosphatase, mitochondrial [Vitis vinifera]